jgi:hypothetical protein
MVTRSPMVRDNACSTAGVVGDIRQQPVTQPQKRCRCGEIDPDAGQANASSLATAVARGGADLAESMLDSFKSMICGRCGPVATVTIMTGDEQFSYASMRVRLR